MSIFKWHYFLVILSVTGLLIFRYRQKKTKEHDRAPFAVKMRKKTSNKKPSRVFPKERRWVTEDDALNQQLTDSLQELMMRQSDHLSLDNVRRIKSCLSALEYAYKSEDQNMLSKLEKAARELRYSLSELIDVRIQSKKLVEEVKQDPRLYRDKLTHNDFATLKKLEYSTRNAIKTNSVEAIELSVKKLRQQMNACINDLKTLAAEEGGESYLKEMYGFFTCSSGLA